MRILPYFILAYFMLGLQVGISRYVMIHGAAPNLALLAVVYLSLNAPRNAALLGSFSTGLLQDLLTAQQPGLYAFSYGLIALLLVAMHHVVNRTHPLTHFLLALAGGFITTMVLLIHSLIHPAAGALAGEGHTTLRAMRISPGIEFTRMLYTAVSRHSCCGRWEKFVASSHFKIPAEIGKMLLAACGFAAPFAHNAGKVFERPR